VRASIDVLLVVPLMASLAGCALHSPPPQKANVPEQFTASPAVGPAAAVDYHWYGGFSSDELSALIEAADQGNLDLAAATERVLQANARAHAAGAALLPEIRANGGITGFSGQSGDRHAQETDWAALLSASYEIDFWGRNRAIANSAQFQAVASLADRATVALTTRATIANTYFQLLALRERAHLAESDVKALQDVLQVLEARNRVGWTDAVELATQRVAIANAQRIIPQLHQQEAEALGALAVLAGRKPEDFTVRANSLDGITVPTLSAGLPAQLLTRRPDLSAAEANLRAADADVLAARAALLPSVALTVSGGMQNPAMQAALLTLPGAGTTISAGATLVQTIFDHGRRRSERDLSIAREAELVAVYRGAVLASLLDVENALSARANLEVQGPMVTAAVEQSQRALDGALRRYQAGSGDYLTLLEAQRALYTAQDQASQFAVQRLQAAVSLYRALGGGWGSDASTAPAPSEPTAPP
jgi:outer membrane protein, multidrug efflux system